MLLAVSVLYVCSLPFGWVGVLVPGAGYEIVGGLRQASWLLVPAGLVAAIAVRLAAGPPGSFTRFLLGAVGFLATLGIFIEYVDNQARAAEAAETPYLGPGFFTALGGTALLVAATVLSWRRPEE